MKKVFSICAVSLLIAGMLVSGCSVPGISSDSAEVPTIASEDQPEIAAAADGYDLTAYSLIGDAVKGVPELSIVHQGARYLFASKENRDSFLSSPEKYLPGFEAHCPVSLSRGEDEKGKPTIWRIHKEKLYFFSSENAAEEFDRDPEATLAKAAE